MDEKGILVVPDIIANSGGVISSYAEYAGVNPQNMFHMIEEKIVKNIYSVLKKAKKEKRSPRDQALVIAQKKVKEAMKRNRI